ncbi:carbohydrate kinase family protein, partial [Thermodesulfobacteriota bacterium]
MPFDVLVAGEIFYDMIFTGLGRMPVLGEETFASGLHTAPGGIAITAIALKRLEIEPALASDLGNDSYSADLRKAILADGVADTLITRHDRPLPT